jgi:hypothetical protein
MLSVYTPPPINFGILEPIFMKLGIYIMAPEPISTAYYTNHSSLPPVCVCMYVYRTVARQRLSELDPSEGISKYQQLKNKSAATGLNVVLSSAHIQMA